LEDTSSLLVQNPTITVGDAVRPFRNDEVHEDSRLHALVS
jgi:molybdenum cofactor sulfurtransferase